MYVNTKKWSVRKMKEPYDIHLPAFIQIIYQRNKVCYFSNINAISIMITLKGKEVNWIDTLFKQL